MSIPFTIVFSCFTFTSFIHTHNHHPLVANLQDKLAFNLGTWYHKHRLFSISWWCAWFVNISWLFFSCSACFSPYLYMFPSSVISCFAKSTEQICNLFLPDLLFEPATTIPSWKEKATCNSPLLFRSFANIRALQVPSADKVGGYWGQKKRFCLNLLWVMSLKIHLLQRMYSFWFWNNINLFGVKMWCCSRNCMD